MRSSIRKSLGFLAIAAGCLIPGMARAQTISATLTGFRPYTFGSVYLAGSGTLGGGVGNILWSGNSSNVAPFNGTFNTYCIDLLQDINFNGTYTYTVAPLPTAPNAAAYPAGGSTTGMGLAKATEMETLFGMHLADTQGSSDTALIDKEAFQLAIWNIIYDNDLSVDPGSGSFYAIANSGLDASAFTTADGFLSQAANPSNQSQFAVNDLEALIGQNGAQDQIVVNPSIPIQFLVTDGAPLPAAAPAGLVLLAGFGISQRRRKARLVASELA